MSNYKQAEIAASTWQRCVGINITNPVGKVPSVHWVEEQVYLVGDQHVMNTVAGMVEAFEQPNQSFPLCTPGSQVPTGATMTDGELYVALYSRYLFAANARDAAVALAAKTAGALAAKKAILDQLGIDIAAELHDAQVAAYASPAFGQSIMDACIVGRTILTDNAEREAQAAYDAVMAG